MPADPPSPAGSGGPALTIPGRFRPVLAVRDLIRSGEAGRLRQSAGISQAAMAAGLGISRNVFTGLENGKWPPGRDLAVRYLRVLRGLANHDQVSRELAGGPARIIVSPPGAHAEFTEPAP